MKKAMGFMAGVVTVAAMGTGVYLMMSKKNKKRLAKTMGDTLDDASQTINKKINSLK